MCTLRKKFTQHVRCTGMSPNCTLKSVRYAGVWLNCAYHLYVTQECHSTVRYHLCLTQECRQTVPYRLYVTQECRQTVRYTGMSRNCTLPSSYTGMSPNCSLHKNVAKLYVTVYMMSPNCTLRKNVVPAHYHQKGRQEGRPSVNALLLRKDWRGEGEEVSLMLSCFSYLLFILRVPRGVKLLCIRVFCGGS